MKLQILIPHYREHAAEIRPLLDSLALQQQVDFRELGVIICHDGEEPTINERHVGDWSPTETQSKSFEFYDDAAIGGNYSIFRDYPFEIKQIHIPHGGVSAARNAALDAATADYVMFCDADDLFCDVCGLHIIFREIDNGGFDTLVSAFREETRTPDGQPVYINHDMDQTFVHGKAHRRKYLIDNNIRFNPALTIHEDSFFNILAQNLTDRAKYCPMPFYLWKWRDGSVCRHDPDYILKTYGNLIDSNDALVDEFVKRCRSDKASFYVGFMVMDAYYTMNKPEWMDKTHHNYREAVERRFREYFNKHRGQFMALTGQQKMQISNGVRQRAVGEGMLMEAVTLEQWLDKVCRG